MWSQEPATISWALSHFGWRCFSRISYQTAFPQPNMHLQLSFQHAKQEGTLVWAFHSVSKTTKSFQTALSILLPAIIQFAPLSFCVHPPAPTLTTKNHTHTSLSPQSRTMNYSPIQGPSNLKGMSFVVRKLRCWMFSKGSISFLCPWYYV